MSWKCFEQLSHISWLGQEENCKERQLSRVIFSAADVRKAWKRERRRHNCVSSSPVPDPISIEPYGVKFRAQDSHLRCFLIVSFICWNCCALALHVALKEAPRRDQRSKPNKHINLSIKNDTSHLSRRSPTFGNGKKVSAQVSTFCVCLTFKMKF